MATPFSATYSLQPPPASAAMSAASKEGSRRSSLAPTASVPDVLDRPRDKTRSVDVSRSALQYLFAEMVSYTQGRVSGISDFERLLSTMGRRVGVRFLAMTAHRTQLASNPKKPQRETRLLKTLLWLQSTFWKAVFGAQADSLERSTESDRSDECRWNLARLTGRYDIDQYALALARPLCPERDGAAECRGLYGRHHGRRAGRAWLCTYPSRLTRSLRGSQRTLCRRRRIRTARRSSSSSMPL